MMTNMTSRRLGCLIVLMAPLAPHAGRRAGAIRPGASISAPAAPDSDVQGQTKPGLLWRVGHDKPGWGPPKGPPCFGTNVYPQVAGQSTELGELKVRPLMGGYGYSWVMGRTTIIADALAGYALTTLKMTPAASDAYAARIGAGSVSAHASNTFVAKPEVCFWYDVNKKVGLNVTAGYIVARPNVTVSSTAGDDRRRVHADVFVVTVGAVYSILLSNRPNRAAISPLGSRRATLRHRRTAAHPDRFPARR